jgi:hypothetical protein
MREAGRMVVPMDMECSIGLMEIDMKGVGNAVSNMDMEN